MAALIFLLLNLIASPFKSKSRLEAENAALRHQLAVLQCKMRGRVQFTNSDRLFFIQLYRWFPSVLKAITIIRPETLVLCAKACRGAQRLDPVALALGLCADLARLFERGPGGLRIRPRR